MAFPSKSLDKVSIQLKELQKACDNTSMNLKNIIKKKPKLEDPKELDKAIDYLMDNPDSMQMALKAAKHAPKFFSTVLNKASIVPGSVMISQNGELMKVESVDYMTGTVTTTLPIPDHWVATPEKPLVVEICSADLQYTTKSEGRWLHPDIEVHQELQDLTYKAYCPHCKHGWKIGMDTLIEFSEDYHKDTNQLDTMAPVDEVVGAYIVWKNLKPCD